MHPLEPSSKSDRAYVDLRTLVTHGHFQNGEKLTEMKISRLLHVGRGPVRESILRLEAEGLLAKRSGRRSRIVAPAMEDDTAAGLLARYELREHIESGAARLAAKNMNGWQIEHLRDLVNEIEASEVSGDTERRYARSAHFHEYLMANCGNAFLLQVWETHRLAPVRPGSLELERRILNQIPAEHRDKPSMRDVVEAIAAHDQDEAELRMRTRISKVTEALRKTENSLTV